MATIEFRVSIGDPVRIRVGDGHVVEGVVIGLYAGADKRRRIEVRRCLKGGEIHESWWDEAEVLGPGENEREHEARKLAERARDEMKRQMDI